MKKKTFKLMWVALTVSAGLAFGFSTAAMAARPNATSIVYLDAHDNIIGQKIAWCNNVMKHAGDTDPSNPYKVIVNARCSFSVRHCPPGSNRCSYLPPTRPKVGYFRSATGKSVNYYCWGSHAPGTAFYGANHQCGFSENDTTPVVYAVTVLHNWQSGW